MTQENKMNHGLFRAIVVVAAACLAYGVMQGVHDNYGIMMTGLWICTAVSWDVGTQKVLVVGCSTCGFNMSIIENHLFSQYLSYGIPGRIAFLTLTVYGIATMLGAVLR